MNSKGELHPPMYEQCALITDDDIPNINSVIGIECVNRNDHIAVISSFEAQDVNFEEDEIQIGLHTSEVAAIAIIPLNTD